MSMSPEDRDLLNKLVEAHATQTEAMVMLGKNVESLMLGNAVLLAACSALYAELARVSGAPGELDVLLAHLTGMIEAGPDQSGQVLQAAADALRSGAEALAADLGLQ